MSRVTTWCLAAILVLVPCGSLEAQPSTVLFLRAEQWSARDGPTGDAEGRTGLALGIGSARGAGAARLVLGWVPMGGFKSGWTTVLLEAGPGIVVGERLNLSGQFLAGGLAMRADAGPACPPDVFGCLNEAVTFHEGWGFIGGLGATAALTVVPRLDATVNYTRSRILAGVNRDETLSRWGFGAEYRLR